MFSDSSLDAIAHLQSRAIQHHDIFQIERHDRALDEILGNPGRTQPAPFQVRSALANASKVLLSRRRIVGTNSLDDEDNYSVSGVGIDDETACVDLLQWLRSTPSLSAAERRIMLALAAGHDAYTLATADGVSVKSMRERISRARATARRAYEREVRTAGDEAGEQLKASA